MSIQGEIMKLTNFIKNWKDEKEIEEVKIKVRFVLYKGDYEEVDV